jgi:hypothetical protein
LLVGIADPKGKRASGTSEVKTAGNSRLSMARFPWKVIRAHYSMETVVAIGHLLFYSIETASGGKYSWKGEF